MRQQLASHDGDAGTLRTALLETIGELEQERRIAIYSALPGEPDITPLIEQLPRHQWLFPRVDGERLHFHRVWEPASQLKKGAFGIAEPVSSLPTVPCNEIDIFICPGLAFDPHGGRLGRGRGYYDRMLAGAREDALKIGVGFGFQLMEQIELEDHDVRMNAVLCRG